MRRVPLAGFVLSAMAHVAAVALLVLAVTRLTALPGLFIDLTTSVADPSERPRSTASSRAPKSKAAQPARSSPNGPSAAAERRSPDGGSPARTSAVEPRVSEPAAAVTPPPAPSVPLPPPASPPMASEPATTAPHPDAPVVMSRAAEDAGAAMTAPPPSATAVDASAGNARRSSRSGESPTAADAASSGGAGARAGQGLALAASGVDAGDAAGGVPGMEYADYLARFRQRIQESLRYPVPAWRRGLSGTVHLEVTIQPNGRIEAVIVVQSSSHPALDDAAIETVRSLRPLPFPHGVVPRLLQVRVPVVFELQ